MTRPGFLARPAVILVVLAALAAHPLGARRGQEPQINVVDALRSAFSEYSAGGRFPQVESLCDRIIGSLAARPALDDLQTQQLLSAYELRARARFGRNPEGAKEDFKMLLTRAPGHVYGKLTAAAGAVNPNSDKLFQTVRKEVVGIIVVTVTPEDAEVQLNGTALSRDARSGGKEIPVVAGTIRVSGQKAGHKNWNEEFVVQPVGIAATTPITVALERVSSKMEIITVPAGVEVFIDGVPKGTTPAKPLPENYASHPKVVAMAGGKDTSGVLEILDVATGTPRVEFRLDCYKVESGRLEIPKPANYLVTQKLVRSSGQLSVDGTGGLVYINGERKGEVPYSQELCPQPDPYLVEVRSDRGRQVERVTPVSGEPIKFVANPKPAIAVLSQVGLPDDFRDDLRVLLEAVLRPAERVTFFAPPSDVVQQEMARERLVPSWLQYDESGRPSSDRAREIRPETRLAISKNLAQRLEVQGVAEIYSPKGSLDPGAINVTFLARGSNVPDTFSLRLDDPPSVRRVLANLNQQYPISKISSAIQVADILGVEGAVVLGQTWNLTSGQRFQRGDVIVAVDGRKVKDGSAFEAMVALKKDGDQMVLDVSGPDSKVRQIRLGPREFARVVGFYDETLPINKLLLDFREAVTNAPSPLQSIARLNLAVVLMRAGNWTDAKAELDKVDLQPMPEGGQGISRGTVQYYLGLCLDALDRVEEATRAFAAASESPGALLTADGPLVKPLADEKLKDPNRRPR